MPSARRNRAGYCRPCQAAYMRNYKHGSCSGCGCDIESRYSRCRQCVESGRRQHSTAIKPPKPIIINKHGRPQGRAWERIRQSVIDASTECAICHEPVDKTLGHTHPMGPTVDHIEPLSIGGHPTDPTNLRLAHRLCNSKQPLLLVHERVTFARVAAHWATLGL